MPFRGNARLDPSQVIRTGRGGGGIGRPIIAGGGGIGILLAIIFMVLSGLGPGLDTGPSDATDPFGNPSGQVSTGSADIDLAQECQTGEDANTKDECRIVGYVNSVQKFWADEHSRRGRRYPTTQTVLFQDYTQSACGEATTQVGPFYCPSDSLVYLDLGFFKELRARFGAQVGPTAQGYVIAHEYGHYVQDLSGTLRLEGRESGPQSSAVRIELQADCFAGVWAHHAASTGFLEPLTDAEIADALDAAAAVGDDRIQKAVQGRVNPEAWTHGSSAQRQRWFTQGYRTGDMETCDTFSGSV